MRSKLFALQPPTIERMASRSMDKHHIEQPIPSLQSIWNRMQFCHQQEVGGAGASPVPAGHAGPILQSVAEVWRVAPADLLLSLGQRTLRPDA
jgi:hypothetical protein